MAHVFISYGHVEPDATLAHALATALEQVGHEVFIDTRIPLAAQWGELIEDKLRAADALIAIISENSAQSPMIVTEIETAHAANRRTGRPAIIPLRIGEQLRLRYPLSAYVSRFQHGVWRDERDSSDLLERVKEAVAAPARRPRTARQRTALIERVRGDWIKGILEKSLYQTARIELGMVLDSRPLSRGLDVIVQRPAEEPTPLAPGTPLIDVFDDHQGQLLILGAPGAGKTTLLLELARELLERAASDEDHPIPVVFNLSSWALKRQPLEDWMISELVLRSDAPKKLAREWVTKEQILPLLDGLDEVTAEHREACLAAINIYRADHGWVSCVVCSRTRDYEALVGRLSLPGAVVVQPLTQAQIVQYVTAAGPPLAAVRDALQRDERIFELLDTPLMLSIMALAYKHSDRAHAPTGSADLFALYVDSMFRRRGKETRFPEDSMRSWLQWLAANLVKRGQTVLFLEDVVPEWFLDSSSRWLTAATILFASVASALWLVGIHEFLRVLDPSDDPPAWWSMFLVSWPIALVLAAVHGRRAGPVEDLRLHFPGWRSWTTSIVRGAVVGFLGAYLLTYVACAALMEDPTLLKPIRDTDAHNVVLSYALVATVILGILSAARGLITQRMSGQRRAPGALVKRSAVSAAVTFLVSVFVSLPFCIYITKGDPSDFVALVYALSLLSWAGMLLAFELGGYFLIRHYLARLALWWRRLGPLNYVAFLEAAEDRILLRRVGGGYTFTHRTLMEHLAHPNSTSLAS